MGSNHHGMHSLKYRPTSLSLLPVVLWVLMANGFPPVYAQTPWSTQVDQDLLHTVMPEADTFSEKAGDPPVYRAYKQGVDANSPNLIGYVFLSADVPPEEKGYSAPIDMLIGMNTDGVLTGFKILHYIESFRYSRGDFLDSEGFQEQFPGKNIRDNFRLLHDVDGVSNATISSWAIARGVRNATRRVAAAYLNYTPEISQADIWAANAASHLALLSWNDLLKQGLIVQRDIPTPIGTSLVLSIAYMGQAALGEFFIGKEDYVKAERDASIRFDTREMILFMVGGDTSQPFQQQRFAVIQGDKPPQRIHPRRIVSAGSANHGVIAGHAEFAGAIVMEESFQANIPFTITYQPSGVPEPIALPYQLSGVSLALVNGEPILTPEEAEQERILTAPWYIQLQEGVLWRDTDWLAVGFMLVLLALVSTAFLQKNSRLRWISLGLTLAYLGFYDGGFLSVSHLAGLAAQGPINIVSNLPLLILFLFTLITTLLWGRLFCASLCPFGALQDFITRFVPRRFQIQMPEKLHQHSYWIKYGFLALIIGVAVSFNTVSIFQYFEPFGTLFYFSTSILLWGILIAIVLACVVVERFYCRYLCPLGAALAVVALISPWRIQRVPQCRVCKICEHACPTGAIRGAEINFKECVRCDDCEIKLINRVGTCRHSLATLAQHRNSENLVKLLNI